MAVRPLSGLRPREEERCYKGMGGVFDGRGDCTQWTRIYPVKPKSIEVQGELVYCVGLFLRQ